MTRTLRITATAALLFFGAEDAKAQDSRAWHHGATCYEIFVRSFQDSDGDGVGDLNGLISKLDYINDGNPDTQADLGARCIWLMPISPSPSYHGYDVTNYYDVNPDYGTKEDFRRLVAESHRRGIRIVIDMVLNHSSSEHPYFRHAAIHADSPYRDWYTWLPQHPGVKNPWGGDNWHRNEFRGDYYYGFFWGGMPDLNVHSPAVLEEANRIATFWLTEMGADGFRLDAIKHLAELEQGRIVEHVPATHDFLRAYAAHIRSVRPDAWTVGEVWDTIGAILRYYPDQLDAHFMFETADAILNAVKNGSAAGLFPPYLRLQAELPPHRYAPFLRNHDQTRTMTELKGDVAGAKLAATLLLTLPGTPFVYYGEELGMTGDKPDPRLRTPMHWRRARAAGFTTGMPWEPLQGDSMTANVETLEADPLSLLNLYRRLIHLRASSPALAGGEVVPLETSHASVAAYLRRHADQTVLVVVNLGEQALSGVRLSGAAETMPAGQYDVRGLAGGPDAARLRVPASGRFSAYSPLRSLPPRAAFVFELAARRRG